MKVLFVCNANCNRSPTFERWMEKNKPQVEVRSCGIYYGYPFQLNHQQLDWADIVYVMDMPMAKFISAYYPETLNKVYILGIPDEYNPDDPRLIELIEWWMKTEKIYLPF